MTKNEKDRGFTLVDLVVTLVLIAILAGAAGVRFVQLTETARTAECRANQLGLRTAQSFFFVQTIREGKGRYAESLVDLRPFLINETLPLCPSGGTYILSPAGDIRCSVSSHNP